METATTETAVEVGRELSRVVMQDGGAGQYEAVIDLVVRLMMSKSETITDALVLTTWSASLLQEVGRMIPDSIPGVDGDPRFILSVCSNLLFKTTKALETVGGVSVEAATGDRRQLH